MRRSKQEMQIRLINSDQRDIDDFIEWYVKELKLYILGNLNRRELIRFENYFRLDKKTQLFNIYTIFRKIVDSINFAKFSDEYVIEIDELATYQGIRLVNIADLITHGNLMVASYPILEDAFRYFEDNFSNYWKEYYELGGGKR